MGAVTEVSPETWNSAGSVIDSSNGASHGASKEMMLDTTNSVDGLNVSAPSTRPAGGALDVEVDRPKPRLEPAAGDRIAAPRRGSAHAPFARHRDSG